MQKTLLFDENAAIIREFLKSHGIKQTFLASQLQMSPKTLNSMLCGRRKLPDAVFADAVRILGIAKPEQTKLETALSGGR